METGERTFTVCKVEYAWWPQRCSTCKEYGYKDEKCAILIAQEKYKKKAEEEVRKDKGKEAVVDEDGFTLVNRQKNNKGSTSSPKLELSSHKDQHSSSMDKETLPKEILKERAVVEKVKEVQNSQDKKGNNSEKDHKGKMGKDGKNGTDIEEKKEVNQERSNSKNKEDKKRF